MTATHKAFPLLYEPVSQTPISAIIVIADTFSADLTNLFTGHKEHFEIGMDAPIIDFLTGLFAMIDAVIGDPTGDVLPYSR